MAKIIIIDDDPDIVEATRLVLESKGHQVVSAGNVPEALKAVEKESPDLIILDVMMDEPDDGFYLANKFRKIGVDQPIIMLTSVAKVTGFDFGKNDMMPIDEFLEKPVASEKLLKAVNSLLEKSKGE
ncbi:MAG: response regulator transcription factor [Candidatus Kapaibacterium sp.]